MKRATTVVLLLIAMLWQSVAMAPVVGHCNPAATATPWHWQDEGHHHHDDGTYHVDDSSESVQHLITDHSCTNVALLPDMPAEMPDMGSASPRTRRESAGPNPFLAGPLRPPSDRLTATEASAAP